MITGFLFICVFIEGYWVYQLLNRVDRLEKQLESMDEMKTDVYQNQFQAPIKGFNPAKPKTVLPGEGGAREVQEGAQVFEFDLEKVKK